MGDKVFNTLGASNHSDKDREVNNYYSTPPIVVKPLFDKVPELMLCNDILEPCCGEGHIAKEVSRLTGKTVKAVDLIDRGFGEVGNIFQSDYKNKYDLIITNPPYDRYSKKNPENMVNMIVKMLDDVKCGGYVCLFLKTVALESEARYELLFKNMRPEKVLVSVDRVSCLKSGDIKNDGGAISYCWYVWHKDKDGNFSKETILDWFRVK